MNKIMTKVRTILFKLGLIKNVLTYKEQLRRSLIEQENLLEVIGGLQIALKLYEDTNSNTTPSATEEASVKTSTKTKRIRRKSKKAVVKD